MSQAFRPPSDYLPPPFALGLPPGPDPVLEELRAVRRELEALRREVAPTSSVILTGRDVIDQFRNLQGLTR